MHPQPTCIVDTVLGRNRWQILSREAVVDEETKQTTRFLQIWTATFKLQFLTRFSVKIRFKRYFENQKEIRTKILKQTTLVLSYWARKTSTNITGQTGKAAKTECMTLCFSRGFVYS